MASSLSGKVALITGGSKGIGAALALRLADRGASVAFSYASDASAANEVASKINAKGVKGLAVEADASSVAGIEATVSAVVAQFGKIDILVPMAGILLMKDLASTTEADFDASYNLNVKGPYFLAQKAAPSMPPGSSIIFVSTSVNHASTVAPAYLLYCSTKGAVEQMTRVLAKGLAAKGINVNAVAPGPTATELFMKGKSDEVVAAIAKMSPYNRIGQPEEIADVASFLASKEASWMSGQIVKVNGGMC